MTALAALSLAIWLYLLLARGRFWQFGPVLPAGRPASPPPVAVVVPARNEAEVVTQSLRSLLAQDYTGELRVILVDDGSTDETGALARRIKDPRLAILAGAPRPRGWSGKLWAVAQGLAHSGGAALVLLTDADIVHEPAHISSLVAQAERNGYDLVSEMVLLHCRSPAERSLVPAFVYFFQMLYPFSWVNDPHRGTAAAAGGTVLVRRTALDRIGGIEAVREALIDDVALAAAVKKGGRIWLGHSALAKSVRPYPLIGDLWRMIARTAYVQLRFSPALLAATILGMALTFLVPILAAALATGSARWLGLVGWAIMSISFVPTLRRYRQTLLFAPALPVIATFYMAATIASALNHAAGRGIAWKDRTYEGSRA